MSVGAIIVDYSNKFANGQLDEVAELLDDTVVYWVQGSGTFGKTEILQVLRSIIEKAENVQTEVIDVIETGSKAAVTMKTTFKLKTGAEVVDELCVVAEAHHGRLTSVREYLDQSIMPHFMN